MNENDAALNGAMTLNEVVLRCPAALAVLAEHGMDTCCGGALALDEAAARHGVDAQQLLASLNALQTGTAC